eukprot:GFYU01000982.1.p1 GENE.GFYU01000982.1~~GFYU01000982.1.p1  ORF type:complete len:318 (+),score=49.64 GFYU01000982.1:246-1199(+)
MKKSAYFGMPPPMKTATRKPSTSSRKPSGGGTRSTMSSVESSFSTRSSSFGSTTTTTTKKKTRSTSRVSTAGSVSRRPSLSRGSEKVTSETNALIEDILAGSNLSFVQKRHIQDSILENGELPMASHPSTLKLNKRPSQTSVKVPKPKLRSATAPSSSGPPKLAKRGKKPANKIMAENPSELFSYEPAPVRAQPTYNAEKEKARLQKHMSGMDDYDDYDIDEYLGDEFDEDIIEATRNLSMNGAVARAGAKKKNAKKGGRSDEAARLFDEIVAEIDERNTFLAKMTEMGEGEKYEHIVKRQIAERIEELNRLDQFLS